MVEETIGRITVAPRVLLTVARYAALEQPGVARLARKVPPRPRRLGGRAASDRGVAVLVRDGRVTVDIRIVADGTVNARDLGESVQRAVTNALEEMVGMPVEAVHVYIDSIDFHTHSPKRS